MQTGRPRPPGGFAYVMLLLAVALISLAATAAVSVGATMARRDAERHLLAIGAEFERALVSYAGGARGPRTLDELVRDPRMPGTRRHLRQIYADPLTGRPDWGLVTDPQGFIVGVYSLAEGRPIQRSAFEAHWGHMEEADSYRDWVFGVRAGAGGVRR
ncbi:MAG: type II secretion system protein [Burkholderiales bacterium]|nr:type II secretion system protein [Burkholderiales bacterium]